MRKLILCLLAAVLLLCMVSCAKAPAEPVPTEVPGVTLPPEQTPRALEWNPYKTPYALTTLFGEGAEDDFKAAVQALTERRSTSPITCEAFGEAFAEHGEMLYPPLI